MFSTYFLLLYFSSERIKNKKGLVQTNPFNIMKINNLYYRSSLVDQVVRPSTRTAP